MKQFTVTELQSWAEKLEAQAADPQSEDDPRWLQRWAKKIRDLADQKERALDHKDLQRQKP